MLPIRLFLLAVGFVFTISGTVSAQQFSSTKVAETGVNYPGIGTFSQFVNRPSISGSNIAFGGLLSTAPIPVLALSSAGTVSPIAVGGVTPVPGGAGNFVAFGSSPIGLSGSVYAFLGNGNPGAANAGVYSNVTGSLTPVFNTGTAFPGGGTFTNFSAAAVSGSTFVFSGTNVPAPNQPPIGVFTKTGTGAILTVAGTSTTMPNGAGNFTNFADPGGNPYLPNISGSNIVFGGRNASGSSFGLFMSNGFGLSTVATNTTAIPNGTGNFVAISPIPAISESNIAFQAFGASGQEGVYRWSSGALSRVADRNTIIPGTATTFDSFLFTDVAISGTHVAFKGMSPNGMSGIYTDVTGSLTKVIATGDMLDGKTVNAVNIGQFSMDGDKIAVVVRFTNGSGGVYTFTPVPEPTCLLGLGTAGLLVARLRKRRK